MSRKTVVPDTGKLDFLAEFLYAASNTLTFRLFQNQTGIQDSTVLADLTEADYAGYAAQSVSTSEILVADGFAGVSGNLALTVNGFSGPLFVSFPQITSGNQTVYGVYCTADLPGIGSGRLIMASNAFDNHADPTNTPDGYYMDGSVNPPAFGISLHLWDFFQPTVIP